MNDFTILDEKTLSLLENKYNFTTRWPITMSDFSLLLGCKLLLFHYNTNCINYLERKQKKGKIELPTEFFWTSTISLPKVRVRTLNTFDDDEIFPNIRSGGFMPAIVNVGDEILSQKEKNTLVKKTKNYEKITTDKDLINTLNNLYENGNLKKTGKAHTIYMYHFNKDNSKFLTSFECDYEYVYKGKRYYRYSDKLWKHKYTKIYYENEPVIHVEYGEYPGSAVSIELHRELEKNYSTLKKTSKKYTVDSSDIYSDCEFAPRCFDEYQYKDGKYIRFIVDKNTISSGEDGKLLLSNGQEIKRGDIVWLKVEPIKWRYFKNENLMLAENILFSGIRFDKKNSNGNYEDTESKWFMDNYFSKEIRTLKRKEIDSLKDIKMRIHDTKQIKKTI